MLFATNSERSRKRRPQQRVVFNRLGLAVLPTYEPPVAWRGRRYDLPEAQTLYRRPALQHRLIYEIARTVQVTTCRDWQETLARREKLLESRGFCSLKGTSQPRCSLKTINRVSDADNLKEKTPSMRPEGISKRLLYTKRVDGMNVLLSSTSTYGLLPDDGDLVSFVSSVLVSTFTFFVLATRNARSLYGGMFIFPPPCLPCRDI